MTPIEFNRFHITLKVNFSIIAGLTAWRMSFSVYAPANSYIRGVLVEISLAPHLTTASQTIFGGALSYMKEPDI